MKFFVTCLTFCLWITTWSWGNAQKVAIKSNLLMDGLLNPNLSVEVGMSPRWTAELTGEVNAWTLSHQRRWKHWLVQPGVRYWFCDRFAGHFVGAHLVGGQYNMGSLKNHWQFLGTHYAPLSDNRYEGWMAGVGVGYGYSWILSKHWNLEGEIGAGWVYSRYDRYMCAGCGRRAESDRDHNYFGPTKAALNLVYQF